MLLGMALNGCVVPVGGAAPAGSAVPAGVALGHGIVLSGWGFGGVVLGEDVVPLFVHVGDGCPPSSSDSMFPAVLWFGVM